MPLLELDLDGDGKDETYFREGLYGKKFSQLIAVEEVIFPKTDEDRKRIGPQDILILKTPQYGNILVIEDVVQTTEEPDDERCYHEVAHFALNACIEPPQKVLIIGSDGGMLREAVKYWCVEEIYAVDIDPLIPDLIKKYLPSVADGSWSDPRVTTIFADGAEYVKKARAEQKQFDVIIVDSPDPIGCAESLFAPTFYEDIAKILAPHGVVIRQTGSYVLQPSEVHDNIRQMHEVFPQGSTQVVLSSVAAYVGGYFTFVAASPARNVFNISKEIVGLRMEKRISSGNAAALRWYSPEMHVAAMTLPPALKKALAESEWGRELCLDLHGCDDAAIRSLDRIKEFAKKICEVIGMKAYGEPWAENFGYGKAKTAGPSFAQPLETSLASGHFSWHWLLVPLNIFTCSTLEAAKAVKFSMEFFGAKRAVWWIMPRGRLFRQLEHTIHIYVTERVGDQFKTLKIPYRTNMAESEEVTL